MKIYPLSNSLYKDNYTRLNTDNPVEKPAPTLVSTDLFEKSDEQPKEVAFKGRLGATLGAVAGELCALKLLEIFVNNVGVLSSIAVIFGATAGLGLLGSYIEDKISANGKIENQNDNDNGANPPDGNLDLQG